jgi:hypothetical protein
VQSNGSAWGAEGIEAHATAADHIDDGGDVEASDAIRTKPVAEITPPPAVPFGRQLLDPGHWRREWDYAIRAASVTPTGAARLSWLSRSDRSTPLIPSTPGRLILDRANITQRFSIPGVANGDAPIAYLVSRDTEPANLAPGINQWTARER